MEVCTYLAGFVSDMEMKLENLSSLVTQNSDLTYKRCIAFQREFYNILRFNVEVRR